MRAIFTGFDSAWYPGKTGAICDLLLEEEDSLRIAAQPISASWECARARARQEAEVDLQVWAIDQPLVVCNEQGCRPVDLDLMRAFMRDFQVGAHPANLRRLPWLPDGPIWSFLQVLAGRGYRHEPMSVPYAVTGRFYFECYPHPALVGLFDLDTILRYKKGPNNEGEWTRLIALLRSLSSAELPVTNIGDFLTTGLVHSKKNEDMLDSILCAYVAAYWWRFGVERSSLIGDLSSGYMVTPHSARTFAALAQTFRGRMNLISPNTAQPTATPPDHDLRVASVSDEPQASCTAPQKYDWVYFSNDARWNLEGFCKFVAGERFIVRAIHNKAHIPIPNVLQLKPGERMLLVYKAKGKPYRQLFACTIGRSPHPIQTDSHLFDVFSRIDGFDEALKEARFDPDSVMGCYTGIYLSETPEDLHGTEVEIQKPVPMMAIQRWNDVFPPQSV